MHYVFCERMPRKRDWRKRQHKLITYKYNGYANGSLNKNKKSLINQHLKQFQATKWNQFLQKEGFLLNKFLKKYLDYSLQLTAPYGHCWSFNHFFSVSLSLSLSLSRSFYYFFFFSLSFFLIFLLVLLSLSLVCSMLCWRPLKNVKGNGSLSLF